MLLVHFFNMVHFFKMEIMKLHVMMLLRRRLPARARMEESKSGPYDLQQAVSLFMARKVGLLTVRMALERSPESVKGLSCTVRRSRGEWTRLKRLHDSTVGSTLFSSMNVSGKLLAYDSFGCARACELC